MQITKDELFKLTARKLWHGEYVVTDNFRAIKKHASVCFEDGALVAVTGRADDRESQLYAAMFADAPAMLLEIANLRVALEAIENIGAENPNADMTKEMFKLANDALVAAAAEQSVQSDGEPAEYIYCECPSCHATGLPELFIRRRSRKPLDSLRVHDRNFWPCPRHDLGRAGI